MAWQFVSIRILYLFKTPATFVLGIPRHFLLLFLGVMPNARDDVLNGATIHCGCGRVGYSMKHLVGGRGRKAYA